MSNKDDCINRRDVIDAMKDMYRAAEKWLRDATDDMTKARAESCMASLVEIKLRTEKLPAVQPEPDCALPEIIRCKNCKYWVVEEDEAYCDLVIVVSGAEDGSGFCSEAKRKMDNE